MNEIRKEALMAFHELVKNPILNKTLPFEITELFATQKNSDCAKKILKNSFNEAVKYYFSRFVKDRVVNADALLDSLVRDEKPMRRHLGDIHYDYVKLLAMILKLTEEKKKGLLAS